MLSHVKKLLIQLLKKVKSRPTEALLVLILTVLIFGFWGRDINRGWESYKPQLEYRPETKERIVQIQNHAYIIWSNGIYKICLEKSKKGQIFSDLGEAWKCQDKEEERLKSDPNTPSKTVQQKESYMGLSDKKWFKVIGNYLFELPF